MLNLAEKLAEGKAAKFVSLLYRNNRDEVARHVIVVNFITENMYKADLETLQLLRPGLTGVDARAADALIASLEDSLTNGIGNNELYTCADTYEPVAGLRGVRLHKDNGILYINGISVGKTIVTPGKPYPIVNSAPLTIAKNKMRRDLKVGAFRMFKIAVDKILKVSVSGETIDIEAP